MFGRYTVRLDPGVKALVKGRIQTQSPLFVGGDDPVYFVSSVPCIKSITGTASCKEGIIFKVTVQVRFSLPGTEPELQAIAAAAGDSTPASKIRTISAEDILGLSKLDSSLSAAIHTHVQNQNFFALRKAETITAGLQPRLRELCAQPGLVAAIEACTEMTYTAPTETQLAEMAVRSGPKDGTGTVAGASPTITYSDPELGTVVEYFDRASRERMLRDLEARRQKTLSEVEIERTQAEAGPQLEKLRQETLRAETDSKLEAQRQELRLKENAAELKVKEQEWEKEGIERNNALLEMRALYESGYKTRRLEEELALRRRRSEEEITLQARQLEAEQQLAATRSEVAEAKAGEAEILRRQKQQDQEVEIQRERELMSVRTEEMASLAAQYAAVFDKLRVPVPDYSGIQTLIMGPDGSKSGEMVTGLLIDLLSRFVRSLGAPHEPHDPGSELEPGIARVFAPNGGDHQ